MKKEKPIITMQMCLLDNEKRIREQAMRIIRAKEVGIHQQTIDKMIDLLSISKAHYDDLKRRFEADGK